MIRNNGSWPRLNPREKSQWNRVETIRTQPETSRRNFLIFLGQNPLKSPDSTKEIQIKPSYFAWISLDLFEFSLDPSRLLVVF
jgi:hypothetical protein